MYLLQLDCHPSGLNSGIFSTKNARTFADLTDCFVLNMSRHLNTPQQTLSVVTNSSTRVRAFKQRAHPFSPLPWQHTDIGPTTLNNLHAATLLRTSPRSREVVYGTEFAGYGQELSGRGRGYEIVRHTLRTPRGT